MHFPIQFPHKGLNDNEAFSGQPPQTTRAALNVRAVDKTNSRRRPAKRSGSSTFNAFPIAATPVSKLDQITYDGRKASYTASAGSTLLSKTTPKSQETRQGCLDRQGNFYFIDGNSTIVKLNVAGEVVYTFTVPISDPQHVLTALFVDNQDNIYTGVGSGGSQSTAKMWRFQQSKGSTTPVQKWVWPAPEDTETTPAYTRRIIVKGDLLYAAHNYPDRAGAFVTTFIGALANGLTQSWSTEVAYPINDLIQKPDGSLVGCSLPFVRGVDPRFPQFTRRTKDATYRDVLTDFDRRVWRWQKGDDLIYDDGAAVNNGWIDRSGKNRALIKSVGLSTATVPLFRKSAINGKPGIHFRGTVTLGAIVDQLQTVVSASLKAGYADGATGLLPNYQGAMAYGLFVVRLQEDPTPTIQTLFWQNKATGAVGADLSLWANRNNAGVATTGVGTLFDTMDASGVGMGSLGTSPYQFDYGEAAGTNRIANNCATLVISILLDGGTNAGVDNASTAHSLIRVNGKPFDRWCSAAGATLDAGYLGYGPFNSYPGFKGDVAEMLVLRDYTGASQGILSHPHYPHNIHTAAVAPVANAYSATTAFNATEMEKCEGIAAHEYGVAHLFPAAAEAGGAYVAPTYGGAAPFTTTNNSGNYPHPYSLVAPTAGNVWNGPPRYNNSGRSEPFLMHSPQGVAWKLDGARGDLQWVVTAGPADSGGGVGYSVACSADGQIIYSVGPAVFAGATQWDGSVAASNDGTILRAWEDKAGKGEAGYDIAITAGKKAWLVGNTITFTGANWTNGTLTVTGTFTNYVWTSGDVVRITAGTGVTVGNYSIASGSATTLVLQAGNGTTTSSTGDINGAGGNIADNSVQGTIYPSWQTTDIKIDVDDHDNVYVPWAFAAGTASLFKVYGRLADASGTPTVARLLVSYDDSTHADAFSVVCPTSPPYRYGAAYDWNRPPDATVARTARAEYVWVNTAQTGALPNSTAGVMKVGLVTTTPVAGANRTQSLLQVNGGIIRRFTTAATTAFVGASTLAEPQLSTTADYIDSAILFNNVFYTDGISYVYVDPINDTCLTVKPADGGTLPKGCRLSCNWRGRWVLAGAQDDRSNWHMSEMTNPFGWNRFPVPLTSTRAISGNNARVGLCPDMVNALVPYSDDVLIFLCDHSVWQMVGDPADEGRASGFSLVSDITGGAFGRSWTKDPNGNLYFFGSRGDVFVMRPGSVPINMTMDVIHDRMSSVDLTVYRAELVWNVEDDGLHVFFVPIGAAASPIHYFWQRGEGWWSDQMPSATSPRSLLVADGDLPADRVMLFGASNGTVSRWDKDAKGDCGSTIQTNLLIGPLAPTGTGMCYRFRNPVVVTATEQNGVNVNLYTSSVPESKGTLQRTYKFHPGRNQMIPIGMRGVYAWVEIDETASDTSWALESMEFEVFSAGREHADTP